MVNISLKISLFNNHFHRLFSSPLIAGEERFTFFFSRPRRVEQINFVSLISNVTFEHALLTFPTLSFRKARRESEREEKAMHKVIIFQRRYILMLLLLLNESTAFLADLFFCTANIHWKKTFQLPYKHGLEWYVWRFGFCALTIVPCVI